MLVLDVTLPAFEAGSAPGFFSFVSGLLLAPAVAVDGVLSRDMVFREDKDSPFCLTAEFMPEAPSDLETVVETVSSAFLVKSLSLKSTTS